MSDHPSETRRRGYLSGDLPPDERLALDDHLAGCAECRGALLERKRLRSALGAVVEQLEEACPAARAHPSYDEMAAYVDGRLPAGERDLLEEHAAACVGCAADVRDLEEARDAVSREAAVPLPASPLIERVRRSTGRVALPPAMRWVSWAGVAAAAAGLAAWAVTLPLREEVGRLREELRALESATRNSAASVPSPAPVGNGRGGAPAAIAVRDAGGLVTLDSSGRLQGLAPLPSSTEEAVRTALRTGRLRVPPWVTALAGRRRHLRGGGGEVPLELLTPVGTAVETDRPTFRWKPVSGTGTYVVTVHDTRLREVARSSELSVTEWRSGRPLTRGAAYVWQVRARDEHGEVVAPAPPEPEARFRVLDEVAAAEVARARGAGPSHLVRVVVFAEAGLVEAAAQELDALRRLNPRSGTVRRMEEALHAGGGGQGRPAQGAPHGRPASPAAMNPAQ